MDCDGKVEGKTITIGYEPEQIEHIFDYGKEGGLVKITRTGQDASIVNRLTGGGGTRNLNLKIILQIGIQTLHLIQIQ